MSVNIFVRAITQLPFRISSCKFIGICIRSGQRVAYVLWHGTVCPSARPSVSFFSTLLDAIIEARLLDQDDASYTGMIVRSFLVFKLYTFEFFPKYSVRDITH